MTRLDHSAYVTVFENQASGLACSLHDNIHHDAGQIVGAVRIT
jgi:hypothetical protein